VSEDPAINLFGVEVRPPRSGAFVFNLDNGRPTAVSVDRFLVTHDEQFVTVRYRVEDVGDAMEEAERRLEDPAFGGDIKGAGIHAQDVPIGPFREATRTLLSEGETLKSLARRAGWFKREGEDLRGDGDRFKKAVGLGNDGKKTVRYETAIVLAGALNLDPVELGF
jgi:hypothetical protein